MAGITLVQAQAKLTLWMTADDIVSTGQSYSIGERSLTRSNIREIRENIIFWQNKCTALTNASSVKIRRAIPRDL